MHAALAPLHEDSHSPGASQNSLQHSGHPGSAPQGALLSTHPVECPFAVVGVEEMGREKDSSNGYISWSKKTV